MNHSGRTLAGIAICWFACLVAYAQNDEDEARRIAEDAIKVGVIDYLTDRDFKLDGLQIKATARAIDPKEDVKVELREFDLLPGSVKIQFKVSARFRFEGNVTLEEQTTDVRGEAKIGQLVSLEAKYMVDDRGLHVDAKATDIKFSAKITEVFPEDAGGGKEALAKTVARQLRRQKEDILREFNEWQQEYQRKNR
jgi:hypothetical protein